MSTADVIEFPTSIDDDLGADVEYLLLLEDLLHRHATSIGDLEWQGSIDADSQLAQRLREHADAIADLADVDDLAADERAEAIEQAERLLDDGNDVLTRDALRRMIGSQLLDRIAEMAQQVSAVAITSHMLHVSFEQDGRRYAELPLDRSTLRRFARSVARGVDAARDVLRAETSMVEPFVGWLRERSASPTIGGSAAPYALGLLFDEWFEHADGRALRSIADARDRAAGSRSHDRDAQRRAFEAGAGLVLARQLLEVAAVDAGIEPPRTVDVEQWLDVLDPSTAAVAALA